MDATLNPVSGTTQQYTTPSAKPASSPVPAPAPQATPQVAAVQPVSTAPVSSQSDEAYQAALRQAALSFKDVYAVSDQSFTIFKDATGKFITRYVSLRDGSITYAPEPTLVKQLQLTGTQPPSRLAISA